MKVLHAHWQNLVFVNYKCPEKVLLDYLPHLTRLDMFQGSYYLSLVGFLFRDTNFLGVKVPFISKFEEVNLRFYVKKNLGGKVVKGVSFIKEYVPNKLVTAFARGVFKEAYRTCKMSHCFSKSDDSFFCTYQWQNKNLSSLEVVTSLESKLTEPDSLEAFITEHYYGYTKVGAMKTFEYRVEHPRWEYYPVKEFNINVDFVGLYGENFGFLNNQKPDSVFFCKGSDVSIFSPKLIKHGV